MDNHERFALCALTCCLLIAFFIAFVSEDAPPDPSLPTYDHPSFESTMPLELPPGHDVKG